MWTAALASAIALSSGTTYFLSPSGLDSNDGLGATTAWRTLSASLPKLASGDTLTFARGQFAGADLTCTGQVGLTFIAESERESEFTTALTLRQCAGVKLIGFTFRREVQLGDFTNVATGFEVRRSLFLGQTATQLVTIGSGRVEENEFRDFDRTAYDAWDGPQVFARNFLTSVMHPVNNIVLRANDDVAENNVVSSNGGYSIISFGSRTKIIGNLLDAPHGVLFAHLEPPAVRTANVVENNVLIVAGESNLYPGAGVVSRFGRGLSVTRNTIIAPRAGATLDLVPAPDASAPGLWGSARANYLVGPIVNDESVSGVIEDNDVVLPDGGTPASATGMRSELIDLQGCLAVPPSNSRLRTLSADGGPIGAAVLFRGTTQQLLWEDGGFPCGAELVTNLAPPTCRQIATTWGVDRPQCRLPVAPSDAGTPDASVSDGGLDASVEPPDDGGRVVDAGPMPTARFLSVPPLVARCNVPYEYRVQLDQQVPLLLTGAPADARLTDEVLRWASPTPPSGAFTITALDLQHVSQSFVVDVDCPAMCSSTSFDPALVATLALLRRLSTRRVRRSPGHE